jgi:hypothetical protein
MHQLSEQTNQISPTTAEKLDFSIDTEKTPTLVATPTPVAIVGARTPWDSTATLTTTYGRPDVAYMNKDIVTKADNGERIVIAACGPPGLRPIAASVIQAKGLSVEMHCEAFSW